MIRRYLEDPHDPDWVSIAMDRSRRLQKQQEPGPTHQRHRGLDNDAYPSARDDTVSVLPRNDGVCLGKRPVPDWDGELMHGVPAVLVPDDEEDISDTVWVLPFNVRFG